MRLLPHILAAFRLRSTTAVKTSKNFLYAVISCTYPTKKGLLQLQFNTYYTTASCTYPTKKGLLQQGNGCGVSMWRCTYPTKKGLLQLHLRYTF